MSPETLALWTLQTMAAAAIALLGWLWVTRSSNRSISGGMA